jgi:hypothetical protein
LGGEQGHHDLAEEAHRVLLEGFPECRVQVGLDLRVGHE